LNRFQRTDQTGSRDAEFESGTLLPDGVTRQNAGMQRRAA